MSAAPTRGPVPAPDASPDTGPLVSPGYWLKMAAQAYLVELDARLRPLGITHTQFTLLAAISWVARSGQPPTQQAVATFAGADRMMTSKVITTLEAAGQVSRQPHPDDARAKLLALTPTGRTTVRRAVEVAKDVDRQFFAATPAEPLRDALRTLVRR